MCRAVCSREKQTLPRLNRSFRLIRRVAGRLAVSLLLQCFLHADGVGHQFKLFQNVGLVAFDEAFDSAVDQKFGEIALDYDQVQQFRAIVLLGILVLSLYLVHLFFKFDDLIQRGGFLLGRRWYIGALLGRGGFEQGFSVRHGDGAAGNHQFHRIDFPGGLHVAQHPGQVRGELLVF